MKYEELKDFIRNKMRMANGKNYQPVMIKTLNQNEGKSTEDELKLALQKANPEYELSHFNDCPVFYVLTKSNPVARYEEENKIYHLLDYESYTDQEKAWITMDCDSKINEQSEPKYFVLEDEKELENAQKIFLDNLKKHTTKQDKIIIGFPGPEKLEGIAQFIHDADLWWYSQDLPDAKIPRFWNCFGLGEPVWGKNNNIVLEINPPMKGISRIPKGAFVKDEEGNVFICHNGVLGGGNTPAGFEDVYPHEEKWILANDGQKKLRDFILISDITDQELPKNLADYVKIVMQFKSGQLASQKVPYYLLFRYNSEGSQYQDELDKGIYHYPKRVNYTKVVEHAKAIWFDKIDGEYCFWGYGTISKVNSRPDEDLEAISDDFTLFEKESDSIMRQEKFLKRASSKIENMITGYRGFNKQTSILEINKEIFDKITGTSQVTNDDQMMLAHKLFLIEMGQKKHRIPFTDFNHIDFVGDELEYKLVALANSSKILSIDKWDELKSTPEKICSIVRDACASGPKGSQNLIWSPQYNDLENEYFDQLDDVAKKEFGKNLYDFFKGADPIEKRFDHFILFLKKINRVPEIRLLAYLMFLYNPEKYFPIHPSKFNKLLEFHNIQKIEEVSWEKYSQYVELASKIKSFLVKLNLGNNLSAIQVQSYMWIIAGEVSKKFWVIRAGTDGEDWDNQKNAGIIGIHYETIDLSRFRRTKNRPNELTKIELGKEIRKIKRTQGEEINEKKLNSIVGQLRSFFSINRNKYGTKIIAIGDNSTVLGVGNASGEYEFRTDISKYCHTIPVEWNDTKNRQIPTINNFNNSVKEIDVKEYLKIIKEDLTNEEEELDTMSMDNYDRALEWKPNLILYGPPGTGKTFHANKIAKKITRDQIPKIGICWPTDKDEDKIEDFQNVIEDNEKVLWGVNWSIDQVKKSDFPIKGFIYYKQNIIAIATISNCTLHEETNDADLKLRPQKWHNGQDYKNYLHFTSVHRCVPFSHKKLKLNDSTKIIPDIIQQRVYVKQKTSFIRKVTFHPSYSYEDFVEGFRPNVKGADKNPYKLEDGIFKQICIDAMDDDPNNKYVIIIDEINRGNIPKILGELITLIEEDKRKQEYSLKLTYSKDDFFVPKNLIIIGTMNTADKSLMQMDDALKRRFVFEELMPDTDFLLEHLTEKNIPHATEYCNILKRINGKILGEGTERSDEKIKQFRDRQIGHSYFLKIKNDKDLQTVIKYDIIPLLQDYFYGDYSEIQKIFSEKNSDADYKDDNIIGDDNRPTKLVTQESESIQLREALLKI